MKSHLGEFINLHVDYLTVNNIDSLVHSLNNTSHNALKSRFSQDTSLNAENKNKYAHDASSIIFSVENDRITTVFQAINSLINGDALGSSNLYGAPIQKTEVKKSEPFQSGSIAVLDTNIYGLNSTQLNRTDMPKWQQNDILSGIVYTYYTGQGTITVSDEHPCSIDGTEGQVISVKFNDTNTNSFYYILLNRKTRKFLKVSKDELVRLKLVCESVSKDYGAVWDLESYSIRNSSDIEIVTL